MQSSLVDAAMDSRQFPTPALVEHQRWGRAEPGTRQEHLHRRLYLTLQSLRGRPIGGFIKRLQQWERLDRPAFDSLTRSLLRDSLGYARAHVPLYGSEAWNRALSDADPTDLTNWPVLERARVVTDRDQLLARPLPLGAFFRHSSASSGQPCKVAYNPRCAAWNWANEYRAMLWYGVAPGAKSLMLWRNRHPILDWIKNTKVLLAHQLTRDRLEEAARYLLEERPTLMVALPSAAARLARYVGANYPDAPQPLVPFVKVGGEQLYPFERQEIVKYLGGRVVEFYGCTEVGPISAECPEGSRHVLVENVHLEIFRNGQPVGAGEFGDIVVTSLTNRAMPLVRCRVGDRGRLSPEPCRCGRPHPVLAELVSRAADQFVGAEGRLVHGSALGHGLQSILAAVPPDTIGQVLFQQIDERHWKVLVESRGRLDSDMAALLAGVVRTALGAGCEVGVEQVDVIPRETSGKFRYYRTLARGTAARLAS
jgi:phenylacetate-CoA ligase